MTAFKAQLDRDEKSGKTEYQITHAMDVAPVLRSAEIARSREALIHKKNELRPQARLDIVTCMNIRQKHGIDPMNIRPDEAKKFWQIMQTEYPRFLTTEKKVYRPSKRSNGMTIPAECLRPDL